MQKVDMFNGKSVIFINKLTKSKLLLQKDKLIILKEDPYENQLLKTFDFIYWLEQMANS